MPSRTRTTWVPRSSTARPRLRALDSWMPTTLIAIRTAIRMTVATPWRRAFASSWKTGNTVR